jgi:hypothetical protein
MAISRSVPTVEQLNTITGRFQVLESLGLIAVVVGCAGVAFVLPGLAPALFIAIIGAFVAMLVWSEPIASVYVLLASAILIEQWPLVELNPISGRIPFFQSISGAVGIPVPLSPAEMLLGLTFGVVLVQSAFYPDRQFFAGRLALPLLLFIGAVVGSLVYGMVAGGVFRMDAAWAEVRSFFYLAMSYFIVANLVTDRRRLRIFFWLIIGAIGLKGIQGIARFVTEQRHGLNLQAITGHEDVIFFTAFIVLLSAMLFYGEDHRMKATLILLFPPVMFTMFATTRRMAFITLAFGALLVGLSLLNRNRRLFFRIAPVVLVLGVIYLGAFWNNTDSLAGQPARTLKSQIGYTDARDAQSDYWRELENLNIAENIRSSPIVGLGFGQPYQFYVTQPTLEGSGFVYWIYITHNAIFWVWMKMGAVGFLLFWWLMGSAIAYGLILFRTLEDSFLRIAGLFAAVVTVVCVVFAYGDLGLTYARPMIFLGLVLGLLARLPYLVDGPATPGQPEQRPDAVSIRPPAYQGAT